jgi:DNA-binding CsgD family transcriptional regulator
MLPRWMCQRRALLERAEQIANLGSWEWTLETDELLCSDNLLRLYGLDPGEVTPSLELLWERAHPNDRARAEGVVVLARRACRLPPTELRIVRTDGAVRDLQVNSGNDDDGQGRARRLVGIVQDVTDLPNPLGSLIAPFQAPALTARELEILQLAADGLSGRRTAERLVVSPATVKTHFANNYEKLGASDRVAAVAHALRNGLIR